MPVSGAMTFTVNSYIVSPDAVGVAAFVQAKGTCSGASFRRLTIGIAPGGTVSPATDPAARELSINIPGPEFLCLLECLKALPCVIMINYLAGENGSICVSSITCQSAQGNFQVLMNIAASAAPIPAIAKQLDGVVVPQLQKLEHHVQEIAEHLKKRQ